MVDSEAFMMFSSSTLSWRAKRRPAGAAPGAGLDGGGLRGTVTGEPDDAGSTSQPISGTGTVSDPYHGQTQEQIDWFKANAPAGAVIVVKGQSYTK